MAIRLGNGFPAEGVEWEADFMERTAVSALIGFNKRIGYVDISADLPNIVCPTLVITTEDSGLASVEENRAWQQAIPNSRLLVLPGNSYHVAVTDSEKCAKATLEFIAQSGAR